MERININIENVHAILKKIQILEEETLLFLSDVDKNIVNSEVDGWNDKRYYEFKESFDDTKNLYYSAIKRINDEHIPFLKKLIRFSEEYN